MRRVARRLAWTLAAGALVLAASLAGLLRGWPAASPGVPPQMIPASWEQFRTSPGHEAHVGRHELPCGSCHDFEREGFKNPGTDGCKNCHAKEDALGHRGGIGADATSCLTCHAFAPGRAAPTCIGCHAQPHGEAAGIVQHATADCATCHRVHDSPPIALAECATCHDERAVRHASHAGSQGCADCHALHTSALAAATVCSSCHSEPAGPRPAGHDSCVGCHQPHDFSPVGACVRCHGDKPTLAADLAAPHRVCTSCHAGHDPGKAAGACVTCHAGVHVEHGKQGACVSCHAPHGEPPAPLASACTSCHSSVAGSETGAHAAGVACEGCHKPHGFAIEDPGALCGTCHEREVSLVAVRTGHQDCRGCHGAAVAHAPAASPPCGSCHAAERATAPVGHQQCLACHEPHAGEPTPPCSSCHAAEATGGHASVRGGCQTCHRSHGPAGVAAPPACATCHAPSTLPALHTVPGHASCASCHATPHDPPREDRATCTGACHADRRGHQPQADLCTGCHVFRR